MTDTAKPHMGRQHTQESGSGTERDRSHQAANTMRQWADDLAAMADRAPSDSPARTMVARAAEGGHRAADRLEERGIGGMRDELQGFARERPAAFWGGAALAGFALGRLARAGRDQAGQSGQSTSHPDGYPAGQQPDGGPAEQSGQPAQPARPGRSDRPYMSPGIAPDLGPDSLWEEE
jgi:hypothetical protein